MRSTSTTCCSHVVQITAQKTRKSAASSTSVFATCWSTSTRTRTWPNTKSSPGLSHDYPNLCVTGDPDQSIYGWRGPDRKHPAVRGRLSAGRRHPAGREFPQHEIDSCACADRLIAFNVRRKAKTMRTDNPEGRRSSCCVSTNAQAEAEGMARAIRAAVEPGATALFRLRHVLPRQRPVARAGAGTGRTPHPLPGRRGLRLLRAGGNQGRVGLLAADRQSAGPARHSCAS